MDRVRDRSPCDKDDDACTVAIGSSKYNSFQEGMILNITSVTKVRMLKAQPNTTFWNSVVACAFSSPAAKIQSKLAFLNILEEIYPLCQNSHKLFVGTKELPQYLKTNRVISKLREAMFKMTEERGKLDLKNQIGTKVSKCLKCMAELRKTKGLQELLPRPSIWLVWYGLVLYFLVVFVL